MYKSNISFAVALNVFICLQEISENYSDTKKSQCKKSELKTKRDKWEIDINMN